MDMTDSSMSRGALSSRYSRQMLIPQIGMSGQCSLHNHSVLVVGAGGIGSTVLLYLAGAGIGHIHIVDHDVVEASNLHRQIIHASTPVMSKTQSAIERMRILNPTIKVTGSECRISANNATDLIADYDVVIDATDNIHARYTINDACVLLGKPLISGSAIGLEGQLFVIMPGKSPCYRCLYPHINVTDLCKSCSNSGVLGRISHIYVWVYI